MISLLLAMAVCLEKPPEIPSPKVTVNIDVDADEFYVGGSGVVKIEVEGDRALKKTVALRIEGPDRTSGRLFELRDGSYMFLAGPIPGEVRIYATGAISYGLEPVEVMRGKERIELHKTAGVAISETTCKVIRIIPVPGPNPGPDPGPNPGPDPNPLPDGQFGFASAINKDMGKISTTIRVAGSQALAQGFTTLRARLAAGTITGKDDGEFWRNFGKTAQMINEAELKKVNQTPAQWALISVNVQSHLFELAESDKVTRNNVIAAVDEIIAAFKAVK